MAQLVERVLGKDEVTGSIPVSSSKTDRAIFIVRSFYIRFGAANRRFTVDDGAPDLKNKKGECAPRHGDAIADFYFQKKNEFVCPNNRYSVAKRNQVDIVIECGYRFASYNSG